MTPEEMAAAVARASARLDAAPGFRLTCPRCGHADSVPTDPQKSRFTCDKCGCKIAFGNEQPDVTINPHTDRRFLETRYVTGKPGKQNDVTVVLEREYAEGVALEILSVCNPGKWRALLSQVTAARDVPGAPTSPDDDSVTLDEGRCACGAPSVHANGACRACLAGAIGTP